MKTAEIVDELRSLGSDSYKRVMSKYGAREPFFGVKIEYLKKIQKRIKQDYRLALDLYDTGISDAMYLAGLIADETRMTRKDLRLWVKRAYFPLLSEYTVPWVAAESDHGLELALEWIDSRKESIAAAGWSTLSSLVAIADDHALDMAGLEALLGRVSKTIHAQPNRVRYTMNRFLIAAGTYVVPLTGLALRTAQQVGVVSVDMGDTACQVPGAADYIRKAQARGALGKKRKMARC
jgi:3-methyladenine DNA glycosylase AlkD